MDNQLDELKKQWKGLNSASAVYPTCNAESYRPTQHVRSRREKLQRFYRNISIVAAIWIFLGPILLYPQGLLHTWGCAMLSAFFAVMGALSFDLYLRIKRLDFATMSTCRMLVEVERIYRDYIRNTIVGISLAVPMLAVMLFEFSNHGSALAGGIVGAVTGAYIGWKKNKIVRGYLKEIRLELLSVSED